MAEERPGQPIVSFNINPLAIRYYYRGPNPIERIPEDQSTRKDDGRRMELTPAELSRLHSFLSQSQAPDLLFWIIEHEGPLEGPAVLEEELGQPLTVLERRQYHGVNAYRLRLSQPVVP